MSTTHVTRRGDQIEEPKAVNFLLNDNRAAPFWLVLRVWLGYQWLEAGWHKVTDPAWVSTGESIRGYWERAVAIPETGRAPISFDWYRTFIQALLDGQTHTWFGPMVAYGELVVGVALILGCLTGIAAFFGGAMNWNFMMAGSASTNPMLFIIAVGLILAWKVSGFIGLDYYLLPRLGTPWRGTNFKAMPSPARVESS